jgi:hypothetical protein
MTPRYYKPWHHAVHNLSILISAVWASRTSAGWVRRRITANLQWEREHLRGGAP